MDVKVENGGYVLGPTGLPETVEGLEELLQYARLRLTLRRGRCPITGSWAAAWDSGAPRRTGRRTGPWPWPTRPFWACGACGPSRRG